MHHVWLSTVGVLIGCMNVLGFGAASIYVIIVLYDFGKLSDEDIKRSQNVVSHTVTLLYIILVCCIIAIILACLLIAGIIKKNHLLMRPWLICASIGFGCHLFRVIYSLFSALSSGYLNEYAIFFTLVMQLLILYVIYYLYKTIRDVRNSVQSGTKSEEIVLNTSNDNPPRYDDLERDGQLSH